MPLGHRVGQHLGGAGGSLKIELAVLLCRAVAPEAVARGLDQRGDVGFVQDARVSVWALQVPEHVFAGTHHAVDGHIRQALVPALLGVDACTQAHGVGGGGHFHHARAVHVQRLPVGPQQHQFTGAELVAVGHGLADVVALGPGIHERAQLLRNRYQGGGDGFGVQAWGAQNARLHAQLLLRCQQGLHAGVLAAHSGADHLGRLVGLDGFCVCAGAHRYAHHHHHGAGLVFDGHQRAGQRAFGASLANGSVNLREQHRLVLGECYGVGIGCGGDQPDDGRGRHAQGLHAVVDFSDSHAVVKIGCCHAGFSWGLVMDSGAKLCRLLQAPSLGFVSLAAVVGVKEKQRVNGCSSPPPPAVPLGSHAVGAAG